LLRKELLNFMIKNSRESASVFPLFLELILGNLFHLKNPDFYFMKNMVYSIRKKKH
jgi:hypothetical protein